MMGRYPKKKSGLKDATKNAETLRYLLWSDLDMSRLPVFGFVLLYQLYADARRAPSMIVLMSLPVVTLK